MLYDTLENLNQYTGLFPNLDKAIDFIEDNDVSALPLGRTEIDGDDVYVTVMEAEPTPGEGRAFETHSRYMDLQMDLEGAELCEVALGDVEEAEPYDEEKDFALWNGAASAALVLGEGRFAVFMVEEPHKPAIKAQGCDKVKKRCSRSHTEPEGAKQPQFVWSRSGGAAGRALRRAARKRTGGIAGWRALSSA